MTSSKTNGLKTDHADVRFISSSYGGTDPHQSAIQLILAVRPEWASDDSKIEFARFTDGITNTLLKAVNKKEGWTKEQVDAEAILLRAYGSGTAVLIDREREAQNHELLWKHGLAPELLARFNNGMLYRYIKGSVTSPDDLRKPDIYCAVAGRLAEWHATVPCIQQAKPASNGASHQHGNGNGNGTSNGNGAGHEDRQTVIDNVAPGKPPPNVWTVMQKWIFALPDTTAEQKARQRTLQVELDSLVEQLSQRPGLGVNGLVFAHCDLLSGNVIILPGQPGDVEGAKSVTFIDYEYATPSPAAFDLANHFAEWGGFDCDWSVMPTRAQRQTFITKYIESYFASQQSEVDREAEVTKLMDEVDLFRGVPGFYWGIWALIQATISDIDFDYASYAETRLSEYWAWKAESDGSRAAAGADKPLREKRWEQSE
ncbi:hypothetical protein BN1708_000484 [Verticillium longisporum]|uniref:ethanolamine kinase n=2 Tax=Verticillium longisporum TaxID=100787 RepID=A0A0G4LCQ3_VERLO|nr:Ethanolamine kinase 1 like protein [Verticillium longisporum]CRK19822.1 hypothetical protein BN1708_000484 [Verticillium longisporum]